VVGCALHGDLDYAVDFCRAAFIDPSFVRFRAFRSKAEHDQFATYGTGASAVIPLLAARAGQVGIHSYSFEIGVLPRGGLSFCRTSGLVD
jgi:hypothetical protein